MGRNLLSLLNRAFQAFWCIYHLYQSSASSLPYCILVRRAHDIQVGLIQGRKSQESALTPWTTSTSPPAVAASRFAVCELQLSFVESHRSTLGIAGIPPIAFNPTFYLACINHIAHATIDWLLFCTGLNSAICLAKPGIYLCPPAVSRIAFKAWKRPEQI